MNQTYKFLTSLYQYLDEKHYLYLWTIPGKKTYPFPAGNISEMTTKALELAKSHDIYFGIGSILRPLGQYERPKNDEVAAIPCFHADIDIYNPAVHKSPDLPPDIPAAMDLLPKDDIPPSTVILTGYGLHIYWILKEPWIFDSLEERNRAANILRAMQAVIKSRAAARGWKIDTTSDLARVLRLPGTLNRKIPANPVMCQIIEQSDIRYNPSEIEDLLPAPDTVATPAQGHAFERRPTDGPAVLMLKNCMFMQHLQLNAPNIKYAEWLAGLSNIVRAKDGIEAAHQVSALDPGRYRLEDTDKKINEALAMNPQSCGYIQKTIGFQGCPPSGCGVQAPCGWSLSRVAQARAVIRGIPAPSPETVFVPEVLGALAVLKKQDQAEYAKFKATCKGRVNLNDLQYLGIA